MFSSFSFLATNGFYHEDNNDLWQPMNSHSQMFYENANNVLHNKDHHFESIDHDLSPSLILSQTNDSNLVQHPVPRLNYRSADTDVECSPPQHFVQAKRNSTININPSNTDSTIRSYALPRSITTDQFITNKNTSQQLYYYPSVQDVLDALNRRSNFKETFV